jgi:Amt family ammonium transporter
MTFSAADTIWVLLGTALVFFMQAGFAIVESGFTRAKNAGNILMKNLMDFSIGAPIYWLVGFGIMFGAGNGFFGSLDIFTRGTYEHLGLTIPTPVFVAFQTVFCATAATIVSGAMAERTKFKAYCFYSLLISLIIYPVSGHWIWGGGWLAEMGFHDFAGSTAVHMVGGLCALIGAKILGPRTGKYDKDGKPKAILGHNLPIAALGVFILWFCWFGFNGASTLGIEGENGAAAGHIFMTTNLAASMGAVSSMLFTWIKYKKPDVSMTFNGVLAGLVGITAGCDGVSEFGAVIIGIISGIVIVLVVETVDQKLKIDDPVGAIGVHCACGALGTIFVGFFDVQTGLFYGHGAGQLLIQLTGVASVAAWVGVTSTAVFLCIKHTIGLRASLEEETLGLDITEHNLAASYADFAPMSIENSLISDFSNVALDASVAKKAQAPQKATTENAPQSIKLQKLVDEDGVKITKIAVVMNASKFDQLKGALSAIEVTGMTVTQVMGCGVQKGRTSRYRGVEVEMNLLPKLQVEIVVSKVPVDLVVDVIKSTLYTGNIGDGKIFIYDVENVVRVRTGEEGFNALQDEAEFA